MTPIYSIVTKWYYQKKDEIFSFFVTFLDTGKKKKRGVIFHNCFIRFSYDP